jgi:hypothetical protein
MFADRCCWPRLGSGRTGLNSIKAQESANGKLTAHHRYACRSLSLQIALIDKDARLLDSNLQIIVKNALNRALAWKLNRRLTQKTFWHQK